MTHVIRKFMDGHRFELLSDSSGINEPYIMVPASVAESLDGEMIGKYVKQLIDDAWLAKAFDLAEWLVGHGGKSGLPKQLLEECREEVALIERYAGQGKLIDLAVGLIDEARAKVQKKVVNQRVFREKRRDIRRQYNRLFMAIGRRDGFRCANCKEATNDLQIDHKIAVANGGSNDLENLQLLCAPCNMVKGAKA